MTDWNARFDALRETALASPHPTEKIAAQILYPSGQTDSAQCNARPPLVESLGVPVTTKIANRSLYVHAETRAILHARRSTRGATLIVTDPFCPNCAKQIAMADITRVVIDHHGFEKRYISKNREAFDTLSLAILAWAGVAVFIADATGHLVHQDPALHVIRAAHPMPDRAVLEVSGSWWGQRALKATGMSFEGPIFTEKYDARIEAPIMALMAAKRKGLLPKTLRAVRLSDWPDTPRAFIDGLELGLTQYQVISQDTPPVWAAELSSLGINVQ